MFKFKFIFLLFVLIFTFLSLNFLFNYKILVNNFLAKFGYEIVSISLKEQEIKLIKEQLTNIIIDKDKSINALKNEIFSLEYHNDKIINDHLDSFEYVKVNNNKNKNINLFKNNLFKSGINGIDTESFYLSINNQYLYFLSATGIIGKSNINIMNADKFEFKKIKSNLLDLISTNNFILNNDSSTKDLVVTDEYIYVSYTKELSEKIKFLNFSSLPKGLKQVGYGKVFMGKDWRPEHLRFIYETHADAIVDKVIDGVIEGRYPKLISVLG